jgi:hypothetical protein
MKTYLLVEDDVKKASNYRQYANHYGIKFVLAASPAAALNWWNTNAHDAIDLAGVMADFELRCGRPTNQHLRIDVADPSGQSYTVSTGLGVLDWIHSAAPDMPLWALTDASAAHAPLFMSAASLWLDAKPLVVERLYSPETPLGDGMFAELNDPAGFAATNPTWKWVDESRVSFEELLHTTYSGVAAFDWLEALTHLGRASSGFIPTLTAAIRRVIPDQNIKAYANTLAPCMARWQLLLDEVYQDFPVDRDEDRWPVLDEDDLPTSMRPWDAYNPITDFLGENTECKEFFAASDVRMALSKWHRRGNTL